MNSAASSKVEITRMWADDALYSVLPKSLVAVPLPDDPEIFGFMDDPIVQAGLNPGRWSSGKGHLFGNHIPDTYSISGMTLN